MSHINEIIKRVKETVGLNMTKSTDYEVLSQAIKDKTGEKLGINTLKRMFGFNTERVVPRRSTMDIIALYLGCDDSDALMVMISDDADISCFMPIETLEVQALSPGAKVMITYSPNRVINMLYKGNFIFEVTEMEGSRHLMPGDQLTITQLAVGHRLVATHVNRQGKDLGTYEAAKYKGLKSVKII